MAKLLRIGTRDSQLAIWQAKFVQSLLTQVNINSELVLIKSEGDKDLQTPLYEMGVQGIFTKTLDIALLGGKFDIAVHSMKDVPTQLASGIVQAAVPQRASFKDILVYKDRSLVDQWQLTGNSQAGLNAVQSKGIIATSSIRRKAQWLNRYPDHVIENIRGNVNTRLRKVHENNWDGAIFAAAGLERIGLRPENAVDLDWMLPAPAQGAIMVVCREDDNYCLDACRQFNDSGTSLCTKIERDFLRALAGGCSTPISALAVVNGQEVYFHGNLLSVDGKDKVEVESAVKLAEAATLGYDMADALLNKGGKRIAGMIQHAK